MLMNSMRAPVTTLRDTLLAIALSVVFFSTSALCEDAAVVHLTILHLNDVYAMEPVENGRQGGLARVATIRKHIRLESPFTLLVLAGDTISPSIASSVSKGADVIAVWNAVGLDVAVPGNHEFDFGKDVLLERIKESHFPWVATNMTDSHSQAPLSGTEPFVIRKFGGITVGFVGMTTPDTEILSNSTGVRFEDPCAAARRVVPHMREAGVQVIIGVTHLPMSRDKELAACANVDAILGGHEHVPLHAFVGHTPILKVGSDARHLGRLDLFLEAGTGRVVSSDWAMLPITADIPESTEVAKVIANSMAGHAHDAGRRVLGQIITTLNAKQVANRTGETNVGDLIAEAYRRATHAEIGLVNGGSIRSDRLYEPGPITQADVHAILPFNNPVVALEVTGRTLRAALEHGLSKIGVEKADGRFLQVAGLTFRYMPGRSPGDRLVEVRVGDKALDENTTYSVAISQYLVNGGDGYEMFRDARYLSTPEPGRDEASAFIKYIESLQSLDVQPDHRITPITLAP